MIIPLEKKKMPEKWYNVGAYRDFLAGSLHDHQFPANSVATALQDVPKQPRQDGE